MSKGTLRVALRLAIVAPRRVSQHRILSVNYFCLDIGGTNTRGVLFSENREILARADGPGGALSLGVDAAETAILAVWQKMAGVVAADPADTRVSIGIAGNGLSERVRELRQRLSHFAETIVVGDGYGALLAATEGTPGAMISVGTGVAALRLRPDNTTLSISGWGFPGGDRGSGAWLGLNLVSLLTRQFDRVRLDPAPNPDFVTRVTAIIGRRQGDIQSWLTTGRAWQYGQLAPLILEESRAGDPFCRALFRSAAREIADVGLTLYPEGTGVVHLMGGLGAAMAGDCAEAAPGLGWRPSHAEPVFGLLHLATGDAPPETLLPRPGL